MARKRMLSPGFFTNHLLAACPPLTRLLFQGLWTIADFDGVFVWDPPKLAMMLLPRDNFDPDEAMARLERDGFIKSFGVDGQRLGYIVKWLIHQDPHPLERPMLPKPTGDPDFLVRVKALKYRKDGDTGFGMSDLTPGHYLFQQVASKLQACGQEVVSNASPSSPSNPASPSLPSKKKKTSASGSGSDFLSGVEEQEQATPKDPTTQTSPEGHPVYPSREGHPTTPDPARFTIAFNSFAAGPPHTPLSEAKAQQLRPKVISCCEVSPGWMEKAEELLATITDQEEFPYYSGGVPAQVPGGNPFVAKAAWFVNDPTVVPRELEKVRAAQKSQKAQAAPITTPVDEGAAKEAQLARIARIEAEALQETR
jgi:hypothetical protein